MKRLLVAFSMLLMAFMITAAPQSANAQTVPSLPTGCTRISGTATTAWPNGNYSANCGGTTTDANSMVSALNNLQSYAARNMAKQGVQLLLFPTVAAYNAVPGHATVPAGAWSVTKFDTNNRPVHIAILEANDATPAVPITSSLAGAGAVSHYTVREVGRSIDTLIGYVKNLGIVTTPFPSISTASTTEFAAENKSDWTYINGLASCSSGTGLFSGRTDPSKATPTYICNGTQGNGPALASPYSLIAACATPTNPPSCNQAVITQMIPEVFTTSNQIWSELYSATRDTPISKLDYYLHGFQNFFPCSFKYQNVVEQQGRKPIPTDFTGIAQNGIACAAPSAVPILAGTTSPAQCYQVFTSGGGSSDFSSPSYGYVFYCGTVTMNNGNAFGLDLWYLNPALRTALWSKNSYVYLFTSGAEYTAIYSATNPVLGHGDPTGTAAGTYPYSTNAGSTLADDIWYTNVFFNTQSTNTLIAAFTAAHETGHTFDDTRAPQTSSTPVGAAPSYDIAMQHDWQTLDYYDFAGGTLREPCNQGPTPYIGPFVGIVDPSNPTANTQFCTGGSLTPGYEATTWGTKKNHQILQAVWSNPDEPARYQAAGVNVGANPGYTPLAGWREWHSEALAIQARRNSSVHFTPYKPQYSALVDNGYFQCTAGPSGWANLEATTGAAVTTANAPCQGALPGWTVVH